MPEYVCTLRVLSRYSSARSVITILLTCEVFRLGKRINTARRRARDCSKPGTQFTGWSCVRFRVANGVRRLSGACAASRIAPVHNRHPAARRLRRERMSGDPPGFSSTPEKSPDPVAIHGGQTPSRDVTESRYATCRLRRMTTVPAISTSSTMTTRPRAETAGTGACSRTSATRNPKLLRSYVGT